jgi:hypothetical protein
VRAAKVGLCAGRVGAEARLHDPEVLGYERFALAFAVDDQFERRRLHTTGGKHVAPGALRRLVGREREVAREHGTPDEVDIATRGSRRCEVVVERAYLVERALDLLAGDSGVAYAVDRHVRVRVEYHTTSVRADELALAVEVGRDRDMIRLLGQIAERLDDAFLRGVVRQRGIDQVGHAHGRVEAPLGVLLGKIDSHDVAFEADADPVLAIAAEPVHGRGVDLVRRGFTDSEDLGQLLGGDVLFGDDKLHRAQVHSGQGASSSRVYTAQSSENPARMV